MTKTNKNPHKEQREWTELLHAKKRYILRKQEEEDSMQLIREVKTLMKEHQEDDGSPK